MRYITIPADLTLENLRVQKTGEAMTLSFRDFVRGTLVNHVGVTETNESIVKFMEIAESVKNLVIGDEWELDGPQHELLARFAQTFNYDPNVKLSILSFIRAITSAPTKSSAVVKENGETKTSSPKTEPKGAEA